MVTLRQDFLALESVVSGKALDDRAGVYIAIEAIKRAKKIACDLYFVGTTQEEVGLRGAQVAGFVVHPQIGIALDTTLAVEMPGVSGAQRVTQLGKGVALKLADSSSISHTGLVRTMKKLAEERKIPYQMEILPRGGTDAGAGRNSGDHPVAPLPLRPLGGGDGAPRRPRSGDRPPRGLPRDSRRGGPQSGVSDDENALS
jgi:endoglucanase